MYSLILLGIDFLVGLLRYWNVFIHFSGSWDDILWEKGGFWFEKGSDEWSFQFGGRAVSKQSHPHRPTQHPLNETDEQRG